MHVCKRKGDFDLNIGTNEESNLEGYYKFCLGEFQGFELQMPMSNLRNLQHHGSSYD